MQKKIRNLQEEISKVNLFYGILWEELHFERFRGRVWGPSSKLQMDFFYPRSNHLLRGGAGKFAKRSKELEHWPLESQIRKRRGKGCSEEAAFCGVWQFKKSLLKVNLQFNNRQK